MTATATPTTQGSYSGVAVRRQVRWLIVSVVVVIIVTLLSLMVGSRPISPAALWDVIMGAGTAEARAILLDLRLPRTLIGLLGGAAFAVAGVIMQGHTRNPLADPGLLGVGAGASVAVVLAISLLGLTTPVGYLWFSFGGAAIAAIIVMAFGVLGGRRRRDSSPATLVLAGAAVTALLGAITGIVLLLDAATLDVYRFWTVGSLAGGRGFDILLPVLPFLAVGMIIALAHGSTLDSLSLGDDIARSLGRKLLPARLTGLGAVTLLVGAAVACCGSIGFAGLVVPHAVRRLVGSGHRWLLPQSALLGGALVVLADVVGRLVVHPAELPVGVVLGLLGAPVFLLIVMRMRAGRA